MMVIMDYMVFCPVKTGRVSGLSGRVQNLLGFYGHMGLKMVRKCEARKDI
jgi:hypothetical protein